MIFTATERGQICLSTIEVSTTSGVFQLNSFSESFIGETADRYFHKEFRVSNDGLLYTSWQQLNNDNLQQIITRSEGTIYVQLRYTRIGSSTTGSLILDTFSISETDLGIDYEEELTQFYIGSQSILRQYLIYNPVVRELALNLFNKLKQNGILSAFIERESEEGLVNQDFEDFWFSVTKYFAVITTFCKKLQTIYNDPILLSSYLAQHDLILRGDENKVALQTLCEAFFEEIFKRGTISIVKKVGETYSDGSEVLIQGELLRLITYQTYDEFIYNLPNEKHYGWNIGNSSPLYKGLSTNDWLINKLYEPDTEDVLDLDLYPLQEPAQTTLITDSGRSVMRTRQTGLNGGISYSGIGPNFAYNIDKKPINIKLPYEIYCEVKVEAPVDNAYLLFGACSYTDSDNYSRLQSLNDGSETTLYKFFEGFLAKSDVWYKLRGLIFPANTPLNTDLVNDLGFAHCRFVDDRITRFLSPFLFIQNGDNPPVWSHPGTTPSSYIRVRNIKVKLANLPFSTGLINTKSLIYFFLLNNSVRSDIDVKKIVRDKLIPYDTNLLIEFIDKIYLPTTTTTSTTTIVSPTTLPPETTTTTTAAPLTSTTTIPLTTTTTCPPDLLSYNITSDTEVEFTGTPSGPFSITFVDELGITRIIAEGQILPFVFDSSIYGTSIYGTYTLILEGGCVYVIIISRPSSTTTSTTLEGETTTTTTACPVDNISYEVGDENNVEFTGTPSGPFDITFNSLDETEVNLSGINLPFLFNSLPYGTNVYGTYTFISANGCIYIKIVIPPTTTSTSTTSTTTTTTEPTTTTTTAAPTTTTTTAAPTTTTTTEEPIIITTTTTLPLETTTTTTIEGEVTTTTTTIEPPLETTTTTTAEGEPPTTTTTTLGG